MPWGGVPATLGTSDVQQQPQPQQDALRQRHTAARALAQQVEVQRPVQGRPAPVSPARHKVCCLKHAVKRETSRCDAYLQTLSSSVWNLFL